MWCKVFLLSLCISIEIQCTIKVTSSLDPDETPIYWIQTVCKIPVSLDCTGLSNGVYFIGCKAYATCTSGTLTEHECLPGRVFNNNTDSCDDEKKVPAPCGLHRDCSSRPGGSYADLELNCTSFFTCAHHVYFGHNFCTPGTVFENTMGTCVWPVDAYPPCGTKV